jgi:hypothetical protein
MNISILGASRSGKTWLASALTQRFQTLICTADASSGHVRITEMTAMTPSLDSDKGLSGGSIDERALLRLREVDLILLTGLDLPWAGERQDELRRQQTDARLRDMLQQAGLAYGVVYGSGLQRLRNALRLISPQDTPPARWTGACERCADPDCEFRLFTALQSSKAAAHPAA